ncbi:hypothetical protein HME9304_01317 [Flagellimonas maritima]|uniref:Lipoprotein n=1 Tax=Flagellimonas maritima TaxID=1383885 RepID=A0A2Z4LSS1_9FLAO|nr:hypothetical protein [Allomuricauda aurantiaca]AWX44317.1 hypothetical protein HME9304_01317 [Allomuricauda aurantiaca]
MKTLFILLLFIVSNACDTSGEFASVENSEKEEAITQQQMIGPDEILFKIKIVDTLGSDKQICGTQKDNVFAVEVVEVVVSGSSLSKKLPKNHQMDVTFLFEPNLLSNGKILEAKAKETLCQNTSMTYFTVIEHKILE